MNRASLNLLTAIGLTVAAPVWAVSLPTTGGSPANDTLISPVSLAPAEGWAAGSASLVPLMAADMQANQTATVEAPATGEGGAAGKPIDDITFVKQATEGGRKEVDSAREAIPQLQQPELIRIAEMLVNDHSGANSRLAKIAEAKGWPMPPRAPAGAPPSGTSSSNFDATWTAEMIAGHERSVALYRAQAQGGEDRDLRKYARDTLPTIEKHLEELRRLQK